MVYLPHNDWTVPIKISVIRPLNEGYIGYFSFQHVQYDHIFTSGLKSDINIMFLDHDFFKDLFVKKFWWFAYIWGRYRIINICMDFEESWPKIGFLRGKMRERGLQRTRFYICGFLCLCQFWRKSIKKCDRESVHKRRHRYTDRCKLGL